MLSIPLVVFVYLDDLRGEVIVPPSKKLEDLIHLTELCVDLLQQNEEHYAEVRDKMRKIISLSLQQQNTHKKKQKEKKRYSQFYFVIYLGTVTVRQLFVSSSLFQDNEIILIYFFSN